MGFMSSSGVSLVGRLVAGRECHRHDSFNHPFKMDDCGKAILQKASSEKK